MLIYKYSSININYITSIVVQAIISIAHLLILLSLIEQINLSVRARHRGSVIKKIVCLWWCLIQSNQLNQIKPVTLIAGNQLFTRGKCFWRLSNEVCVNDNGGNTRGKKRLSRQERRQKANGRSLSCIQHCDKQEKGNESKCAPTFGACHSAIQYDFSYLCYCKVFERYYKFFIILLFN